MTYYKSLNSALRERFGVKVYKLALDGGFTCPNRDGTVSTGGCTFCAGGSGDFSVPCNDNVSGAIETAKHLVSGKGGEKYIAYFQSYTSTYAPYQRLEYLYTSAINHPDVAVLSIGTRPDCLPEKTVRLLKDLNNIKPVWVELGLQTIHEKTAQHINRGYSLSVFDDAIDRLIAAGLEVIVHMIIGLPGETEDMICRTAEYIGNSGADGIKFQLLHVLEGTVLADEYRRGEFEVLSFDRYISILEKCVQKIPHEMVVHRLTGDGAKRDLIAPLWSADKKNVLNAISRVLQPYG